MELGREVIYGKTEFRKQLPSRILVLLNGSITNITLSNWNYWNNYNYVLGYYSYIFFMTKLANNN